MSAARQPELRSPPRAPAGELVSAAAALVLAIVMFASKWYGVAGIPGRSEPYRTVNAWQSLSVVRWLMLATILSALIAPIVHATKGWARRGLDAGAVVTVLATVTAVLVAYRALIELPSAQATVDQKLGAYLGLLAITAIALASYDAVSGWRQEGDPRARRTRRPKAVPNSGH